MKLYNTLSRKVEELKPLSPPEVKLYTCGPTVYDYMHIGNLRKFVFDDSLRRVLEASDLKAKHAMNITDVGHLVNDDDEGEDKLEKGARREDKTVWQVAEHYIKAFKKDVAALNILPPNVHRPSEVYARATDFTDEQIAMVNILLDKGFAYQTEQAIYFDVSKLPSYGELTGQKLDDKEEGARAEVVTDSNKRHPQDFAIWFFALGRFADHEMRWPSPWGEGFPDWHFDYSTIIHSLLGEPLDIHTGGVDHIGVHHPNEMAQTEAAFGVKLANYWLHSEHLLVDGNKMSKSLGNFHTLRDVVKKGFEPLALRLLYLQAHYRSQMNFTWEALEGAAALLKNLQAWADRAHQLDKAEPGNEAALLKQLRTVMENDLNTPKAIAAISQYSDQAAPTAQLLKQLDELLGLDLANRPDINAEQKELIAKREAARSAKDWAKADALRQQLATQKIEIDDTATGPLWFRA